MIEIQRTIEKEVSDRMPLKTIFKGTKMKVKMYLPLLIIVLIAIPYFRSDFLGINQNFRIPYLICLLLLLVMYFFVYLNPLAKKQLAKKGIKTDGDYFKHWASKEYIEHKYSSFEKRLIELKIIEESNYEKNSQLLREYSEHFRKESERIRNFDSIRIIGSTLLVFILPLWNQFLGKTFRESKINELSIIMNYSFQFLLLIFIVIISIVFTRIFFKEIIENRKRKLMQISNELINIKWNQDIKN